MANKPKKLTKTNETSKENQVYFSKLGFIFLKNLKEALEKLEKGVEPSTYCLITSHIFHTLQHHFDISLISSATQFSESISIEKIRKGTLGRKFKHLKSLGYFQSALARRLIIKIKEALQKKSEQYTYPQYSSFLLGATEQELSRVSELIALQKYGELEKFKKLGETFNQGRPKKCALISSVFGTTWTPTFQSLKSKGWDFLLCLHSDVKKTDSYGCLTTSEIHLGEIKFSSLLSDIVFMAAVTNHPILINGESYQAVSWDATNAVALYILQSVTLKTAQSIRGKDGNNLTYFMYDGLKPVINKCPEVKESLSLFYLDYLSNIDRVIFNSNDVSFGDYLENAYGFTKPRLHFMRYSLPTQNPQKRLSFGKNNDEFHMVCITTCLNTSMDGARDLAAELIRSVLNQKIHFHYYACEPREIIDDFISSISYQDRSFFHVYRVNRNQEKLVNELSQYHVGINPSDYLPFGKVHCYLKDRQYQDGMAKYLESSYSTSALVYAASGLPVILPSGAYDSRKSLPVFIPFVFSEHPNIHKFLSKIDLKKCCQMAFELRGSVSIENHITQLESFLYKGIGDKP